MQEKQDATPETETVTETETVAEQKTEEETAEDGEEMMLRLWIGGEEVKVEWEENEAVSELTEQAKKAPVTVRMDPYGGFEQVGALGFTLPSEDERIVTQPGDLMLYQADKIVAFYGSNTWAYTRLGKITDQTETELETLLGQDAVELRIAFE